MPALTNPTATTISAATTFSGNPTISQLAANSFATIANIADLATFTAEISTSAFVGTLTFYGLEVDGSTLVPISGHLRSSTTIANNTAINTAVALNQVWVGSIATFKAFYVVCTAFTSGSVSVQPGLSAASYAVSVSNALTIANVNSNGPNVMNNSQSITMATDQTPIATMADVRYYAQLGRVFWVISPQIATGAASLIVCVASLFNASTSGKTLEVFSILLTGQGNNAPNGPFVRLTTTDPGNTTGFTQLLTPQNELAGGVASVASTWSSPNGIAASITQTGTLIEGLGQISDQPQEILTNGRRIILPVGSAFGIEVNGFVNTSGNTVSGLIGYIER